MMRLPWRVGVPWLEGIPVVLPIPTSADAADRTGGTCPRAVTSNQCGRESAVVRAATR
jgi:hypothetical protein